MKKIVYSHEGLSLVFYREKDMLRFYGMFPESMSRKLREPEDKWKVWEYIETHAWPAEENNWGHHYRMTGSELSYRLACKNIAVSSDGGNRKLAIEYYDKLTKLEVRSIYLLIKGAPAVRKWVEVKNRGKKPVGLGYIMSGVLNGVSFEGGSGDWHERMTLHVPHSGWSSEGQWRSGNITDFGIQPSQCLWPSSNAVSVSSTGSWSSVAYLPAGILENSAAGVSWFWQIEHNGSWHWEIGELAKGHLYLSAGGPNEQRNHCWKDLKPGESFSTVPVAFGACRGGFNEAVKKFTLYRRKACLSAHEDNKKLSVIFNDYMNCLKGDTTTEKEIPLIDAAAKAGCEYFVLDAGWYTKRNRDWNDRSGLGIWQESPDRYPGGLNRLFGRVREKGMIPGLWTEIESVGSDVEYFKNKPDSWFLCSHNTRITLGKRNLLDFRNPQVYRHATGVFDRLIKEYGIGYVKNDYNTCAPIGTDHRSDSAGEGLLEHNRAFLNWLGALRKKYPKLVIENCGGGGLRMDYAMLSRCQLQSCTDQTNYRAMPSIITGTLAAVLPEQLAAWCYPLKDADEEAVIFNMVTGMLCRIHLSGEIAALPPEKFKYVKQAVEVYKSYRARIPEMAPCYPTGTIRMFEKGRWHSFALLDEARKRSFLAVWRLNSDENMAEIPLDYLGKKINAARVSQVYPLCLKTKFGYNEKKQSLSLELKSKYSARLFEIKY